MFDCNKRCLEFKVVIPSVHFNIKKNRKKKQLTMMKLNKVEKASGGVASAQFFENFKSYYFSMKKKIAKNLQSGETQANIFKDVGT